MKKVFQFGYILMGLLIIGVGASLLSVGGLGVDPFTGFNMSLADRLHLTLGVTQLCMNLVLFVYVFLNDKTSIGWGTIMNMTLVGVVHSIYLRLFATIQPWFSWLLGKVIDSTYRNRILYAWSCYLHVRRHGSCPIRLNRPNFNKATTR